MSECCNNGYGIDQAAVNSTAAKKSAQGFLVNPMLQPAQITLSATVAAASGITQLFLVDAVGLGTTLSVVGGANSQTLVVDVIGAVSLAKYLQSFALVITGYDFECTNASELAKNLLLIEVSPDQNTQSKTLFSSVSRNNYQQNANLLNVAAPFVWDSTNNLRMNIAAPAVNTTYTFTMYINAAVPYGLLDQYLAANAVAYKL